jgi:hypothetical protein
MMVMPHTSAHDFYLGIFTRGITGLEMNFVAKKNCLSFLGYYFNIWRGAIDRSGGKNKVDSVAAILIKRSFRFHGSSRRNSKKVGEIKTDSITSLKSKCAINSSGL